MSLQGVMEVLRSVYKYLSYGRDFVLKTPKHIFETLYQKLVPLE